MITEEDIKRVKDTIARETEAYDERIDRLKGEKKRVITHLIQHLGRLMEHVERD